VNNSPLQLLQMMVVKDHGWQVVLPLLLLSTVVGETVDRGVQIMVDDHTEQKTSMLSRLLEKGMLVHLSTTWKSN